MESDLFLALFTLLEYHIKIFELQSDKIVVLESNSTEDKNMGAWLSKNFIEIANQSFDNGIITHIVYKDVTCELLDKIVNDPKIRVIQISKELPDEAFSVIDSILEKKNDLIFRIYGLYGLKHFDISFLKQMKHLHHLIINCHLRNAPDLIDFNVLKELNLKSLSLDAFDLYDYSFINELSKDIEQITINADAMKNSVKFDCQWLLQYKNLHTLWLGKKAKKNLECLSQIKTLKSLSLRGIKLSSFEFLKVMNLEKFELLWNSNSDLNELKDLKSLKQIGLWRINKLENIDFISKLENLEVIKLQDLKHLKDLPDLSKLIHLKSIVLDNTGICIDELDESIKSITERYWR